MKCFLSMSSCVVCLALLIIVGHDQALTAKSSPASVSDPIKILGVKLNKVDTRVKDATAAKTTWLDGLEVGVENTSAKAIRYLVVHVEFAGAASKGRPVGIPLTYGYAPVPNAKRDFEFFQPGAKLNLKVSKGVCDKLRNQLAENGRTPTANELQTKIHLAIFEDRTAWAGGELNYPDPKDPTRWIAAAELTRKKLTGDRSLDVSFSRTGYNSSSSVQTCYHTTGFHLQYCCSDFGGGGAENPYYVGSETFAADPNGHVQPGTAEACCQEGGCCSYTDIDPCP